MIIYAEQVEQERSPLDSALSKVLQYASSWGPEGFPVKTPSQSHSSVQLHHAVWAQAELLCVRCRHLVMAGETLSAAVERKADLVRQRGTASTPKSYQRTIHPKSYLDYLMSLAVIG